MTALANAPEILIAEAEPWTADLLAQLVLDVRADARIIRVSDGETALAKCKRRLPALVIADCNLPDLDGLELLRHLRRHPRTPALPFILISDRLDARSVRAARPLAPSAYLAKPFNAEQLRQRLLGILGSPAANTPNVSTPLLVDNLDEYLNSVREEGQGAPLLASVRDSVSQCLNSDDSDLRELEAVFSRDPQITARLIAAANSAAQHQGMPCQTLDQALLRLGVARTLNLVLGMAIQRNAQLRDPRLIELGKSAWDNAQRGAELAHWLDRTVLPQATFVPGQPVTTNVPGGQGACGVGAGVGWSSSSSISSSSNSAFSLLGLVSSKRTINLPLCFLAKKLFNSTALA